LGYQSPFVFLWNLIEDIDRFQDADYASNYKKKAVHLVSAVILVMIVGSGPAAGPEAAVIGNE